MNLWISLPEYVPGQMGLSNIILLTTCIGPKNRVKAECWMMFEMYRLMDPQIAQALTLRRALG